MYYMIRGGMVRLLIRGHTLMFTTIVVSGAGSAAEWAVPMAMNATARILENSMLTAGGWGDGWRDTMKYRCSVFLSRWRRAQKVMSG